MMKQATQTMGRALVGALVVAFIATAGWAQSITWLGTLRGRGTESYAFDVSANGSVVVGQWRNPAGQMHAFRWTETSGMQDLGTLGGGRSEAYDVSADGSVVVGESRNFAGRQRAFRWTAENGMQDLGTLGGEESEAYGVSADGRVVVGWAQNAAGQLRAFRWMAESGMQDLGTLSGYDHSWALDVSADGSVVVGFASLLNERGDIDLQRSRAFRWTVLGGMEDLNLTYADLLTDGSVLRVATAVSPDGRYIVGWGYNAATGRTEAFLLDTGALRREGDVNGDGCVDDTDLQMLLVAFGQSGSGLGEDLNGDGVVDDSDLLVVLAHYGSGC
jgi:probable HAF family extracellular repeat protein